MNTITSFDLPYLLRQAAVVSLFPLLPLVVFSIIARRRWLWWLCGAIAVVIFAFISVAFVRCNLAIWDDSPVPYASFRVGPSNYSVFDTLPVIALTLWLSAALIMGITLLVLRLRGRLAAVPLAMLSLTVFFAPVGTFWSWGMFSAIEFDHEDTVWANGFTLSRWESVTNGMSHADVREILGAPLANPHSTFADTPHETVEWWVRNWSAGYYAVVWFEDGIVKRKNFWYMD